MRHHSPARLPPLERGDCIDDYQIEAAIQRGGMGSVYAGVHRLIGKRVAIKVLHDEMAHDPDIVQRFVREARAVNSIDHPNVVDVFGMGTDPSGRVYLVMELLQGTTLGERIEMSRLSMAELCDIVVEVASALEAVHAAGVVHRDLKPDNIFLANVRGKTVVKLLDFGIAKVESARGLTMPGCLLGTPAYMAPEQARGVPIDARADIYALGAILFELLTGKTPFTCDSATDFIFAQIGATAASPSTLVPELPPVADVLVGSMLQKDPADRPTLARVRELVEELRASATPRLHVAETWEADATELVDRQTHAPRPRKPRAGWIAASAGALAVAVVGWLAVREARVDALSPIVTFPVEQRVVEDADSNTAAAVTLPAPATKRVVKAKRARPIEVVPSAPKRPRYHAGSARSVAERP